MPQQFGIRALEIHGHGMWSESHVLKALDFINRYDMNALVFHGTDIVHSITFPRKYFGQHVTWTDSPPRRGENAIFNNRSYITNVGRLCQEAGVQFYLEVKEVAFPDEIFEIYPDLMRNGVICPSDPRWIEFLEVKYDELFGDFPSVAGIIVSIGSPEGRVSMAARRCRCERCQKTTLPDWYRDVTAPLNRAAAKHGRRLVVREFSYKPEDQKDVIDGLAQLPEEVGFMVKAYPHDFYPTFPDNPALNAFPNRERWLEYDVHGQYYGWGIFPCFVAEDIQKRYRVALEYGIDAVILRTDWERINDLSCLDTPSIVNLASAAALARDIDLSPRESVKAALVREGFVVGKHYSAAALDELAQTLLETWPAYSKALYLHGFVLNSSSMFPHGVEHAWWTLLTKHSLHIWDPEAKERVDLSDRNQVQSMIAEKDAALKEIRHIVEQLEKRHAPLIQLPKVGRVENIVPLMERYIEGFVRCGKVIVLAKAIESDREHAAAYRKELKQALRELEEYHEWLSEWERETLYSHHLYMLMDPDRVGSVLAEARGLIEGESDASQLKPTAGA